MLTSGRKKSVQDAPTANDHDCNGRKANQAHTDAHPTKSEWDSAVLGGLVWGEGIEFDVSATIKAAKALTIPTVLTADRLSNYKSRIYRIKTL